MLATSHSLIGATCFLAAAPALGARTVAQLTLGALVAAGAALVPDIDHPEATIGRALGPVRGPVTRAVAAVSGGHRQATHSLLAVAVVTVLAAVVAAMPLAALLVGGLVAVAVGLLVRKVGRLRGLRRVVAAVAAGGLAAALVGGGHVPAGSWITVAVGVGVLSHVAADALTNSGVPLLWPHPWRLRLPLFSTGGRVERILVTPTLLVGLMAVAAHTFGS